MLSKTEQITLLFIDIYIKIFIKPSYNDFKKKVLFIWPILRPADACINRNLLFHTVMRWCKMLEGEIVDLEEAKVHLYTHTRRTYLIHSTHGSFRKSISQATSKYRLQGRGKTLKNGAHNFASSCCLTANFSFKESRIEIRIFFVSIPIFMKCRIIA